MSGWDSLIDQQAELLRAKHEEEERLRAENTTMRALLEKLAAPDAEVVSNTGYWYCFFCNSGIGRLPEKFHHEPACPWIEARAFLAEHPAL